MINDCRILGMDNSTKSTGWAVVDIISGVPVLVDYGLIKRGNMDISDALVTFEKELLDVIKQYKPDHIAAEQMFIGANRTTAMSLGYIHGVMLLTARKKKIPVTYYSVMTAKSVVLGGIQVFNAKGQRKTGADFKLEVQAKVFEVLGEANFQRKEYTDDVTDAASIALTFAYTDGVSTERRAVHKGTGKADKKIKPVVKGKAKTASKQKTAGKTNKKTQQVVTQPVTFDDLAPKQKRGKAKITVNNFTLTEQ